MQIVAPAGNIDCLRSSIKAGADAVYLGLPEFGARYKAGSFNGQGLLSAIEFAHLHNVKVFVTLNTLIKDGEIDRAVDLARFAYSAGADAAIVQDIRFIKKLKREIPDFTLHASTQMGIHNAEGAKRLYDLGISRAVLARETLPEDIKKIARTGIEIEFFVQGALCISFSGNCYFSSIASSYSGNRGRCMQLCRKPYIFNGKKGYFLSAKDICLFDRLKELSELGVSAIKIEGRLRSSEYAYTAVKVYKSNCSSEKAKNALKSVYNRGDYCNAYLDKDAPFRVVYAKSQANIGKYIGKINSVNGNRLSVCDFAPHQNDGFKIMRDGREICGAAVRNGVITASGEMCRVGDSVHRTFDGELAEKISAAPERAVPIKVNVKISAGERPSALISSDNIQTYTELNTLVQKAEAHPITESDVNKAFSKTADIPFLPDITVQTDGAFLPISLLNELRRSAYSQHKENILKNYNIKTSTLPYVGLNYNRFNGCGTIIMVEDAKRLDRELLSFADYIALNPRDYRFFEIPHINKPILLNAPAVARGEDIQTVINAINREGIYGVISNNLYTLSLTDKPILLGTGHNIIGKTDLPHISSFESDCDTGGFIYSFGYAPLMTLCHCSYDKCVKCSGNDIITDEAGRSFTLRRYNVSHCYRQLLNCVPIIPNIVSNNKFFDFTTLDNSEMLNVLKGNYNKEYTRGNYNKGLK